MPGRKLLSCALALLLASVVGRGAVPHTEYRFTHLNSSNSELCFDGVSKIVQDSRGFIWIGTFSGLNRYDGTHFRHYRKKELGLESDFIHTILEDRDGNMWIGTDNGVSRYIWKEDRFEPFLLESDTGARVRNKVTFLYCGRDGKVWMVSNYQGCFCYDPEQGVLINYRDREPKQTPEYNVDKTSISFRRLVEDGKGGFWVSKYHSNLFHTDSLFRNTTVIDISSDHRFFEGDEGIAGRGVWGSVLPDGHIMVAGVGGAGGSSGLGYFLQVGQYYLNHDISAAKHGVKVDGDNSGWPVSGHALFVGSRDNMHATLRCSVSDGKLCFLAEVENPSWGSDKSSGYISVYLSGAGNEKLSEGDVSVTLGFDGTVRSSVYRTGWFKQDVKASTKVADGKDFALVEFSIPLAECPVSDGKLRVNFGLGDVTSFQPVRPSTDPSTALWPRIILH